MHRGWLDNPLFGNRKREPFCKAAAWAWLIGEAAFEPKQVKAGGKIIDLQRGQLTHSLRFMAEAWGWQRDRCRRFLKELSHAAMTDTVTATGGATGQMVITICNYDKYQSPPRGSATARATARAAAVRQQCDSSATDSKEDKESKKESPLPPKGESIDDEFDEFWVAFPKRDGGKGGKLSALKFYRAARKDLDAATILAAAQRYAQSRDGQDGQFTLQPKTWLRDRRWEDEDLRSDAPNGDEPYRVLTPEEVEQVRSNLRNGSTVTVIKQKAATNEPPRRLH